MSVWLLALFLASSDAFRLASSTPKNFAETEPSGLNDVELDGATVSVEVPVVRGQELETGIQSEPSIQCACPSQTYDYERIPRDQHGGGCIGACSGSVFGAKRFMRTVTSLAVWMRITKSRAAMAAIRVIWDDGSVFVTGQPAEALGPWQKNFEPGEYLVGDIRLAKTESAGVRMSSINLWTSTGVNWCAGCKHQNREYLFPTGNAFLSGFFGWSGYEIDALGIYLWKPVSSIRYESLSYPTLSALARVKSPDIVASRAYCNSLPFDFPVAVVTEEASYEVGENTCLETAGTTQFGQSLTVSGEIPIIGVEVAAEVSWNTSSSRTFTNCQTTTRKFTRTFTYPQISIPAKTSFDYVYSQWSGTLKNLPFRATLVITFNDGSSVRRTEEGTYTGVSYTEVKEAATNYRENIANC